MVVRVSTVFRAKRDTDFVMIKSIFPASASWIMRLKQVGVRYHIYNNYGCLMGGTKTREQAVEMKRRFEMEDRRNPWTQGSTRFEIREAK